MIYSDDILDNNLDDIQLLYGNNTYCTLVQFKV